MSPLTEPTKLTLAKGQPVPNDPYLYTNTVLLLHGDGANGSTNIVDSSRVAGSPKVVTPVGNAQISTAIADPFGNSARGVLAFDGNGDYLETAASTDFACGTAAFTIEGWCYLPATPSGFSELVLIPGTPGTNSLFVNFRQSTTFAVTSQSEIIATSPTGAPLNTWFHFAVTRSGNTFSVFLNGIRGAQTTNTSNFATAATTARIGLGSLSNLNGYIDELRITKGVARYTSNFTPPTAPFPDF